MRSVLTTNSGLLVLLEVVVYEAQHKRRLSEQLELELQMATVRAHLSDGSFTEQDQLYAAAGLGSICVRHCVLINVENIDNMMLRQDIQRWPT